MLRLVLTGWMPVLVAAMSGTSPPPLVTENDFLAALDADHPAVAATAERLAVVRARASGAGRLANPTLRAVREDLEGPTAQTDLLVSWQLPHADRRPLIATREAEVRAATADRAQQLLALRIEMRTLYAHWALAHTRHARLEALARRMDALAMREQTRAELGESSGLEAQRLALAAATMHARVAQAAATMDRARAEARRWSPALPPDARPQLSDLPPAPVRSGDPPRVREARADVEAARLAQAAHRRFVRSPEIEVGWQRQYAGSESAGGALVGVSWSVPLFDRGQVERATARARLDGARARLDLVEREVAETEAEARTSFRRLGDAHATARTSLAATTRMLDGAEAAFALGEATLTDLLDLHRSVLDAELVVLDLHGAALAAHRTLERVTAAPPIPHPPERTAQEPRP